MALRVEDQLRSFEGTFLVNMDAGFKTIFNYDN